MNLLGRARIERAVFAYASWLEAHGVPRRRRRDLRRELRANLFDAAESRGAREAVEALGNLRAMAAEVGTPDATQPRWSAGVAFAVAAFVLVSLVGLLASVWWVDGVRAADPEASVSGSLLLFPGSEVSHETISDGFSFEAKLGVLPFVSMVVVFVLVARPWRLVSGRSRDAGSSRPARA